MSVLGVYKNNYKKIIPSFFLILLISFLGIFVLGAREAQANPVINGMKTFLGEFLLAIQELIGTLVGWLVALAQAILNFGNVQDAEMVKEGWKLTRDLVNMFFVLVLLAIALATVLRLETYGMKALLPKLIIAALLINFSLVLAGVIIDFAGVLTNFFLQDSQSFFTDIANQMELTKIITTTGQSGGEYWQCEFKTLLETVPMGRTFNTEDECKKKCSGPMSSCVKVTPPKINWGKFKGDIYWATISSLFLSIIFTIIAVFVFGALAFLLLIRVIFIWFLLILAPLAWFFWILPATRHLFSQWWNTFIKWVMFAPAAIFFIWLSVNSWSEFIKGKPQQGQAMGQMGKAMEKVITNEVMETKLLPQVMAPKNFIQFFIACGMLIGSLIVAQKMGIYGAQGAIGAAKWLGKGTAKWAGRRAQMTMAPKAQALSQKWLETRIGRMPVLRQIARPFRAFAEKERADMSKIEEKYRNWTSDNLKSEYKAVNPRSKVAIAKILANRGDFAKKEEVGFSEKAIKRSVKLAKRYGQHRDLLKARPDLAPQVKEPYHADDQAAIREAVNRIKPADMAILQKESLTPEVIKAIEDGLTELGGRLGKEHLAKAHELNPELSSILRQKIINRPGRKLFRQDVENYLKSDAGKAVFGEPIRGETISESQSEESQSKSS